MPSAQASASTRRLISRRSPNKGTEVTSKSLLKRVEGLQGAELKAALDTNLKLMKDHDYLLITTETTEGTCKYVKPFSTVVARE